MRITDLIHRERIITESQYKKLCNSIIKTVKCDRNGWNFNDHEQTTVDEARKWVYNQRLKWRYERSNRIESFTGILVIHFVDHRDDEEPDWPEELHLYKDKTENILEAYFCHKFNIPFE